MLVFFSQLAMNKAVPSFPPVFKKGLIKIRKRHDPRRPPPGHFSSSIRRRHHHRRCNE
jgi:hypothetical protein